MGTTRRKFTLELKTEAAHRVIGTGRTVIEVAGELSVDKGSLARWVRDERRRMETVAGGSDEPLSPAERAELLRLRRQVAEQEKDSVYRTYPDDGRVTRISRDVSKWSTGTSNTSQDLRHVEGNRPPAPSWVASSHVTCPWLV
jgi:transposase